MTPELRYLPVPTPGAAHLVAGAGTAAEQRVAFDGFLEIGRDQPGRAVLSGLLLVADPLVSHRHCVIEHSSDGRWYVRDVSRNGTRVAGRRLVPNVETEISSGQVLSVGGNDFRFEGPAAAGAPAEPPRRIETDAAPTRTIATVLVGDIRDYTVLVRSAPTAQLQRSVARVFEILTAGVIERGGTIKEYPGDAVLAFWEGPPDGVQTSTACRAALELDQLARRIAADSAVWEVTDFPLLMDWALATGPVLIQTFGGAHPQGLSLVGEPVVLAFRLEKLAGDDTGHILTCGRTRTVVGPAFEFRDLGEVAPKGFNRPGHVYSLLKESDPATITVPAPPDASPGGDSAF